MVKVYKIAITGGPCSGKSTSMKALVDKFSSDFKVFTLPECATMIVKAGVTIIPSEFTEDTHTVFTKGICQLQMDIEKFFEEEAKNQKKDVIIITDRGVIDNFAYCTETVKNRIYQETGWDQNFTCVDRYDLVVHLVTAANGAEEFYTLENNEARSESPEVARFLDRRTHEEWMIHPKLVLVDNSQVGFQKKIDRVVDAVSSLVFQKPVGTKMTKILLNCDPKKIPNLEGLRTEVFQETVTYLVSNDPKKIFSIKKRVIEGSHVANYSHTERHIDLKEEDHKEINRIIDVKTYFDFIKSRDPKRNQINRKVINFSLSDEKLIRLYNLEIYSFTSESEKKNCQILNKIAFGEKSVDPNSLVILRSFSDTQESTTNALKKFYSDQLDVTNNKNFFVNNISRKTYEPKTKENASKE